MGTNLNQPTAIEIVRRARRVSTPILAIETGDVAGLAGALAAEFNGSDPVVQWDGVRGLSAANDPGIAALSYAAQQTGLDPETLALQSANPVEALRIATSLPGVKSPNWAQAPAALVSLNAHLFFSDPFYIQAVANIRDAFKVDGRTLILLGPSFELPPEIRSDIVVLDDPFPGDEALREIVREIADAAGFADALAPEILEEAVDATRGLSSFGAEQVLALSATPDGFDLDELWRRKISAVNQTKGLELTIKRGGEDVGGLEAILGFADGLFAGARAPKAIVWIDEIEKQFGGLGAAGGPGDSSGVTQDALGAVLRYMDGGGDSKRSVGLLFVGPPGTGKSLLAQTIAAKNEVPLFTADLGATKGSLVGESERAIREMFRVVDGVADGSTLVIATCNKLEILPPELRRRFTLGTWFCDLPSKEEREAIWAIHKEKNDLAPSQDDREAFDDDGWTGAEIRNACDLASRLDVSIAEASRYIVPVAKADPKAVEALRLAASGRWLSASDGGAYSGTVAAAPGAKRSFRK